MNNNTIKMEASKALGEYIPTMETLLKNGKTLQMGYNH